MGVVAAALMFHQGAIAMARESHRALASRYVELTHGADARRCKHRQQRHCSRKPMPPAPPTTMSPHSNFTIALYR